MKKYVCNDYGACGQRIKNEAKLRQLRRINMMEILHFANPENVSSVYSGKTISDDVIETLSRLWGLRIEYLLCADDWKTVADMEKGVKASNISEYDTIIHYLGSIGLSLLPTVYWVCNPRELYWNYWDMEKYMTETGKNYAVSIIDIPISPKCDEYVQEQFEEEAWQYSDDEHDIYIELKSNPYDDMKNLSEITKNENEEDYRNYRRIGEYKDGIETPDIEILYQIEYEGEKIGTLEVSKIQSFFAHIDAMCKTSIQTVLCDMVSDFKCLNNIFN